MESNSVDEMRAELNQLLKKQASVLDDPEPWGCTRHRPPRIRTSRQEVVL